MKRAFGAAERPTADHLLMEIEAMKNSRTTSPLLLAALFAAMAVMGGAAYAGDATEEEATRISQEIRQELSEEVVEQLVPLGTTPPDAAKEGIVVRDVTFYSSNRSSSLSRCFRRCAGDIQGQIEAKKQEMKTKGEQLLNVLDDDIKTKWGISKGKFYCRITLYIKAEILEP